MSGVELLSAFSRYGVSTVRDAVRTRLGGAVHRLGRSGPEVSIIDLETLAVVGAVSPWYIDCRDRAFREAVTEEVLTPGGGVTVLTAGPEKGSYETHFAPGDPGFARAVCDRLPMPYDVGDRSRLEQFDPPWRHR